MAKLKKTTAMGRNQRALKGRASARPDAISRFQAAQGIARASNEALGRDTRMVDNPEAGPSQAGRDAAMADDPDAAPSQAGLDADTPPRTAPDHAAHARAVKAEKHAHRKEVHDSGVQQAAYLRSCKHLSRSNRPNRKTQNSSW
ncbi:hypothetical protein PF002_g25997 [Phytophthora fragariae]|uniref:Uncharacterized protein n=3 Tax=Phytophthora TaxID=4783 RepID=A0A6A3QZW2_9STRA|nr:hypothetical protein PF009_g26449 [Phytophthora fragariae]KAE8973133.1 hypothetical protein PF011_g25375 [Phytophthora fragariae]KAE9086796.1 hypothetical protein PF006_g25950 [Phytophthora fragariae]KAE9186032.1 hypothetical protein PF002_g25997 [Phytophthora fragariae]KAE9354082.1 hypothetical protein PR003_g3547 [Phytophthora rubi]